MRVEVAFAVPLSAVIWTTYSPGTEKRAVVTSACESANVTVPGPDTWLHATAGAGPGGGGGGVGAACWAAAPRRRCLRGCWPTPVHAFMYVLPWRITTRSGPATALKAAGSACAESTPSPPNASSTNGEATTTAVAFPAVFNSSRLVSVCFLWLTDHLVLSESVEILGGSATGPDAGGSTAPGPAAKGANDGTVNVYGRANSRADPPGCQTPVALEPFRGPAGPGARETAFSS